jgi:hypothetical protein
MSAVHGEHKGLPVPNALGAPTLLVIPNSATEAFVWSSLSDGGSITAVRIAGAFASVLDRKKLFRPGNNLEVLFIEAAQLRDGVECELQLTPSSGQSLEVTATAQLARWDNPETARVLNLIASRYSEVTGAAPVLERYLAFISVWQAPCRLVTSFSDGCIVEVDAAVRDGDLRAYGFSAHGLRSDVAQLLAYNGGKIVLWLSDLSVRQLYLEISGNLVRVNLDIAQAPITVTSQPRTQSHSTALVDALHHAVESPSRELMAWIASQCSTRAQAPVRDAVVEVLRAVRLPSEEVVILLGISDAAYDLDELSVEAFGVQDPLNIKVVGRENPREQDEWQQQIIVTFPAPVSAGHCYKLGWIDAGQTTAVWIRETDAKDRTLPALARDFLPVASVDPDVFATILYPLATAADSYAPPSRVEVCDFGASVTDSRAELYVFVGNDVEAAHRTVLALFLTSGPARFQIHLCCFNGGLVEPLAAAAREWSQRYGLPVRMTCYSARTTEAQVVRHVCTGSIPAVFLRASVVPRRSDWLLQVVQKAEQTSLVIGGNAAFDCAGNDTLSALSIASGLGGHPHQRLRDCLSAAVVNPLCAVDVADMPRFYTLEGFLLGQAIRRNQTGATMSLSSELDFIYTDAHTGADEFSAALDLQSLKNLAQSPFGSRTQSHPRRAVAAG